MHHLVWDSFWSPTQMIRAIQFIWQYVFKSFHKKLTYLDIYKGLIDICPKIWQDKNSMNWSVLTDIWKSLFVTETLKNMFWTNEMVPLAWVPINCVKISVPGTLPFKQMDHLVVRDPVTEYQHSRVFFYELVEPWFSPEFGFQLFVLSFSPRKLGFLAKKRIRDALSSTNQHTHPEKIT